MNEGREDETKVSYRKKKRELKEIADVRELSRRQSQA